MTSYHFNTISELSTYISRGSAPKYTEQNGTPVINQKCIRDWRVNLDLCRLTDHVLRKIQPDRLLKPFDVLVNSTGVGTLGRVAQIFDVRSDITIDSHVTIVRPNPDKVNPLFFGYAVKNKQTSIEAMAAGSTGQTELSKSILGMLEIIIIPNDDQKECANLLKKIDDKIELNRQMNETLEAMAQAIFKDWFVDFGPVRRKQLGETDPVKTLGGLTPNPTQAAKITALFPDNFGDDGLPEGWENKSLEEHSKRIMNGGTPRKSVKEYWDGGKIPWLTSGEVRQNIIINTKKFITQQGLEKSSTKLVPAMTPVVALYGATAGQVSFVASKMTTNQAISSIIPKGGHRYFIFLHLKNSVSKLENSAVGSAQQNISRKIVAELETLYPCEKLLFAFEKMVSPLFQKIIQNYFENQTLAETRDYLLPKLMSGEVRVADYGEVV